MYNIPLEFNPTLSFTWHLSLLPCVLSILPENLFHFLMGPHHSHRSFPLGLKSSSPSSELPHHHTKCTTFLPYTQHSHHAKHYIFPTTPLPSKPTSPFDIATQLIHPLSLPHVILNHWDQGIAFISTIYDHKTPEFRTTWQHFLKGCPLPPRVTPILRTR